VVAITHLDIATDRLLAQAVPTIDIMLGGHDHNIHSQYQGEVFIHKSGQNGMFLSEIEFSIEKKTLTFGDKSMTKISILPNIQILLNRDYEPDPVTKEHIETWNKMLPKDSTDPICLIAKTLYSVTERVRTRETNMASLFADALKVQFDADMAMVTGGAVRGDGIYYPGTYFTKGMLDKEAPFPNKCMVVEITGKTFLQAVEYGLSFAGQTVGAWPHFSRGVNIEFDRDLPVGSRVIRALLKNKEIDPEKTYTFASNSFIFDGGDGYAAFKTHKKIDHKHNGKIMSEAIKEWMEELKLIHYDEYDLRLYEKGQYNMWKVIFDKLKE
jgi:5'-nucleotidase/UDP-sugar diphosphatase